MATDLMQNFMLKILLCILTWKLEIFKFSTLTPGLMSLGASAGIGPGAEIEGMGERMLTIRVLPSPWHYQPQSKLYLITNDNLAFNGRILFLVYRYRGLPAFDIVELNNYG